MINGNVTSTARKAGTNDATTSDVLENYTFTSDTAGIGKMGTITDYSNQLKQIKLGSTSNNMTVEVDLDDGFYTKLNLDLTEFYNKTMELFTDGNVAIIYEMSDPGCSSTICVTADRRQ